MRRPAWDVGLKLGGKAEGTGFSLRRAVAASRMPPAALTWTSSPTASFMMRTFRTMAPAGEVGVVGHRDELFLANGHGAPLGGVRGQGLIARSIGGLARAQGWRERRERGGGEGMSEGMRCSRPDVWCGEQNRHNWCFAAGEVQQEGT